MQGNSNKRGKKRRCREGRREEGKAKERKGREKREKKGGKNISIRRANTGTKRNIQSCNKDLLCTKPHTPKR